MAFSAQVYRSVLRHRPPSLKQLLSARLALRAAIQQVRGTVRHWTEFANLIRIMLCIADTVMPNPYIPVPSASLTFASPLPKAKHSRDAPPSAQLSKEDMPTPLLKHQRVVRIRNSLPILIQELPIPISQPPLDITSPEQPARDTVVLTHLEDRESSDTSENINYFSTVSQRYVLREPYNVRDGLWCWKMRNIKSGPTEERHSLPRHYR